MPRVRGAQRAGRRAGATVEVGPPSSARLTMPEWNYLLSVVALEEAPALGAGLQGAAPVAVGS